MNSQDHYVIFSGANERAIVACCRYFAQNTIPFSIIARPRADKILLTTYKKNVERFRSLDALDAKDMCIQIETLKRSYPERRLIFVPSAESINRIILEHRRAFLEAGLDITLCDETLYSTLSDKATFNALAQSYGIALPEQIEFPTEGQLPVVAKPETEFSLNSGKKLYPQLLFSSEQLRSFSHQYAGESFFFQRYIDGQSYYLLVFMDKTQVNVLWQKNCLQQADGKSIIAADICACPDKKFELSAIEMLTQSGFTGFLMIEMMREKGVSYLIEANPRLWGPFQLAINNGFNPQWLNLSGVYKKAPIRNRPYFWLNGLLMNLAEGKTIRRFSTPPSYLARLFRGDIYSRRDTCFLFAKECSTALKYFINRKRSGKRSENVTARID